MGGVRNSYASASHIGVGKSHASRLPVLSLDNFEGNGIARRLKEVYTDTLSRLMSFDKYNVFSTPADPCAMAEYRRIVKRPMDFTLMQQKIEDLMYLDDPSPFDEDIALIVNNVKAYNPPSSARYQAALKLEETYVALRQPMVRRIAELLEEPAAKKTNGGAAKARPDQPSPMPVAPISTDTSERYRFLDPTSATKKRRTPKYTSVIVNREPAQPPRTSYMMHPIIHAVNQTMMPDARACEPVGVSLSTPEGLNRILDAIESMHGKLLETPYAKMTWFEHFIQPYRRIMREFEYRKYAAQQRSVSGVTPRAGSLLMRRLKSEPYKDSIVKFVGSTNMPKVNVMFPNLMDTLSDLQVNQHLIVIPNELKF